MDVAPRYVLNVISQDDISMDAIVEKANKYNEYGDEFTQGLKEVPTITAEKNKIISGAFETAKRMSVRNPSLQTFADDIQMDSKRYLDQFSKFKSSEVIQSATPGMLRRLNEFIENKSVMLPIPEEETTEEEETEQLLVRSSGFGCSKNNQKYYYYSTR